MKIEGTTQEAHKITCDALIISAVRNKAEQKVQFSTVGTAIDKTLDGVIQECCANGEFKGGAGELLTIHPMGRAAAKRVIVVGLGTQETLNIQSIRRASAIAARHAQSTGAQTLALALNQHRSGAEADQEVQAQVEGALLGLYTFRKYQQQADNQTGISQIQVVTPGSDNAEIELAIARGEALASATNFARDLVNEPPNVLTPSEMAFRANTMAQEVGLECQILDKGKMKELGMGGLLGVTKGSAEPPQFIILRYKGAPNSKDKGMALVGKGITFDTGGISLKPADRMDEMKGDMGGAAAVLGAMKAIATLKPAINVTALVPTCENMPSGTAFHPGDILRISNGKTIEIINTDAEGRLILADALSYAVKEGLSPIIDLATLTGAIVVALGTVNTGLYCNDEQLTDELLAAGRAAGEKYWPMPLDDDYQEQIKSDIADIKQTGGRPGGSITAAKILEQFVGHTKWAHLDIAGTSYTEKKSHQEKGATGVGVRTLAELAVRLAQI